MKNNKELILAKEWFKKAQDDYLSAKVIIDEGGFCGTSCFLSQQIAEKYLKGFLIANKTLPPKVHDLIKLLNLCKKIDKSFKRLESVCIFLNDYYVETRYPMPAERDYTKKEAKEALSSAKKIEKFVIAKLI